jgi:ATP-dependent DNA helicase HFM1/MER3
MDSSDNMIVSAPTSAGKTVLFELAIVKMIKNDENKCLYLAPIKSLCH